MFRSGSLFSLLALAVAPATACNQPVVAAAACYAAPAAVQYYAAPIVAQIVTPYAPLTTVVPQMAVPQVQAQAQIQYQAAPVVAAQVYAAPVMQAQVYAAPQVYAAAQVYAAPVLARASHREVAGVRQRSVIPRRGIIGRIRDRRAAGAIVAPRAAGSWRDR